MIKKAAYLVITLIGPMIITWLSSMIFIEFKLFEVFSTAPLVLLLIIIVIYSIYGLILFIINQLLINLKLSENIIVYGISSSVFLVFHLIAFGTIQCNIDLLKSVIEYVIISIYHSKEDPIGSFVLSAFNFPLIVIIPMVSYIVINFIVKKLNKIEFNKDNF